MFRGPEAKSDAAKGNIPDEVGAKAVAAAEPRAQWAGMQNEVGGKTGAGEPPKQKRLSEVQMAIIRKAAGGDGARGLEILKRYANFGITEASLKDAVK